MVYWRKRSYPVEVALQLLDHHKERPDVYLSIQRFRGRRRPAYLLSIGSLLADLDYYRVPEALRLRSPACAGPGARSPRARFDATAGTGYLFRPRPLPPVTALPDPPRRVAALDC